MKDALGIFEWAQARGDANVIDRIIVKILPDLIKAKMTIVSEQVYEGKEILVDEALYDTIEKIAKTLIEEDKGGNCHV